MAIIIPIRHSLFNLPQEIFIHVTEYLGPREIRSLSITGRLGRDITNSRDVWGSLLKHSFLTSFPGSVHVLSSLNSVRDVLKRRHKERELALRWAKVKRAAEEKSRAVHSGREIKQTSMFLSCFTDECAGSLPACYFYTYTVLCRLTVSILCLMARCRSRRCMWEGAVATVSFWWLSAPLSVACAMWALLVCSLVSMRRRLLPKRVLPLLGLLIFGAETQLQGGTGVLLVVLSLPAYIPFLLLGYTVGILATLAFVIVLFSRTGFVWPLVALVGSVLVVCLGTGLKAAGLSLEPNPWPIQMLLVRAVYTIVISAEAVVVMSDCCNGWRTSRCYCGSVRSRPHLIGLLVAIVLGALLEWLYVTITGEPSILQYSPSAVASLLVYIVNTISGVFFFCAMPWAIFALTTACMRRSVMWADRVWLHRSSLLLLLKLFAASVAALLVSNVVILALGSDPWAVWRSLPGLVPAYAKALDARIHRGFSNS